MNYYEEKGDFLKYLRKTMRIMRLSLFLIVISTAMAFSANSYSQNTKLSLDLNKATVKEVLKAIEDQSEYLFFYQKKHVDLNRQVTLHATEQEVETILNQLFAGTENIYVINDRQIVIGVAPKRELERQAVRLKVNMKPVIDQPQQKEITGKVTDTDRLPLPGVSVIVKGTTIGTVTNADGEFSLNIPLNAESLQFSFVGMQAQEVPIEGKTVITMILKEETIGLEEVVAVGYGMQKKATITGAVSKVKGEDIMRSPTTNVSNSLTGILPGIVTVQSQGEPGRDGSIIRIRGISTFGNADPLVIIDGMPGRSLERIDPASIESISILKDASAAIYGSRAANGVILVTTKRGKLGKPQVRLNYNYGFSQPTRIPEMCNAEEYATLLNEIGLANYTNEEIQKFKDGSDPWRYPDTDWINEILKPWSLQNKANVEISGGNENLLYFVMVGKTFQDGFYYNSGANYNQYDFRSNLDGRITKNAKLVFDVSGRMEDRNATVISSEDIFYYAMRSKPTMQAYWPNGLPGPDLEAGIQPVISSTDEAGYDKTKRYVLNSNIDLDVNIPWIQGLSVVGKASVDKTISINRRFQKPIYIYSWDNQTVDANNTPVLQKATKGVSNPELSENWADGISIYTMAMINYQRSFGLHGVSALAGIERITGNGNSIYAYRKDFLTDAIDQLFAGSEEQWKNNGSAYQNARLSYLSRVNYNYKEKYLLEAVARYDGSYIFPKNKRFGFFPSISAGWRISEEDFWNDNIAFIEYMKLRASYGQTGNDRINEYQYLASYAFRAGSFITNTSEKNKAVYETKIPNENITWEVANQTNFGIDAEILKGKMALEVDYFSYLRTGLLWNRNATVPATAGFTLPRENIGKSSNKGFDFKLTYNGEVSSFVYSVGINGLYAENKVVFIDEPLGLPEYQQATGKPIPENINNYQSNLYYVADGIFKDQSEIDSKPHWNGAVPGDIIFKDMNNDGKIDASDRVYRTKSNFPKLNGGVNFRLKYKQFDLFVLFQGASGADKYISIQGGDFANYLKDTYDDRWTPTNTNASKPRTITRTEAYWKSNSNTFFLYNTDYLRFKTFEIGYNLQPQFTNRIGLENVRFYLSGNNLFTYTPHLKDFDPEPNKQWGAGYPIQRIINTGISVTF